MGPPVGGLMQEAAGHQAPFLLAAALATVNGGLLMLWLVERDDSRRGPALPASRFVRDRRIRWTAMAVFIGAGALSMLEPMLPLTLADRLRVGAAAIGLLFGAATLAHGIASPVVGALVDRVSPGRLIGGGLAVMGALLPVIAIPRSLIGVGAVLVLFAVSFALVLVPALAIFAWLGGPSEGTPAPASAYALFNLAFGAGMVVGPIAGGAASSALSVAATLAGTGTLLIGGGLALLAREA
jgi:predicted MFS family arabinose efflux permease